jgi:hypothetical protein
MDRQRNIALLLVSLQLMLGDTDNSRDIAGNAKG